MDLHLSIFNSSTAKLVELVNSQICHPQDVENLKVLQNMVLRAQDLVQEMVVRRTENENNMNSFDMISGQYKRKVVSPSDDSDDSDPTPKSKKRGISSDVACAAALNSGCIGDGKALPSTRSEFGPWNQYEEIYLKDLVEKNSSVYNGRNHVDWSEVGKALGRNTADCHEKWRQVCHFYSRKGPYKTTEDDKILTRVKESLEEGKYCINSEVWNNLEKELGRPARFIKLRWKNALVKKLIITKESDLAATAAASSASRTVSELAPAVLRASEGEVRPAVLASSSSEGPENA